MLDLRPFSSLGHADHGWLHARHHFSFADYTDPHRLHWGALRVWNDDTIAPNSGFDLHPHRDMEIVTVIRSGTITHRDGLGNHGTVDASQCQVMSAGTGIVHSEHNLHPDPLTLYQIWILPARRGLPPRWETASPQWVSDGLTVLASGLERHQTAVSSHQVLPLYQDAAVLRGPIPAAGFTYPLAGHGAYLVADGAPLTVIAADGQRVELQAGDGLAVSASPMLRFETQADAAAASIVMVELAAL